MSLVCEALTPCHTQREFLLFPGSLVLHLEKEGFLLESVVFKLWSEEFWGFQSASATGFELRWKREGAQIFVLSLIYPEHHDF